MAKVTGLSDNDLIHEVDGVQFRAMRRSNGSLPAKEWYEALDPEGAAKFLAAAKNVAASLRVGRPGVRTELVRISYQNLMELRITLPKGKPPHLRALYLRRGNVLWLTHGFTKQKNALPAKEVTLGDQITGEWLTGTGGR